MHDKMISYRVVATHYFDTCSHIHKIHTGLKPNIEHAADVANGTNVVAHGLPGYKVTVDFYIAKKQWVELSPIVTRLLQK
jgi:hypothetical protein